MNVVSQVERGVVRDMVHAIRFRADVLEHILQNPVVGTMEISTAEIDHILMLGQQIDDLKRYIGWGNNETN